MKLVEGLIKYSSQKNMLLQKKQQLKKIRAKYEGIDVSNIKDEETKTLLIKRAEGMKNIIDKMLHQIAFTEKSQKDFDKYINSILEESFCDKVLEYLMFNSWPWYLFIILMTALYGVSCN